MRQDSKLKKNNVLLLFYLLITNNYLFLNNKTKHMYLACVQMVSADDRLVKCMFLLLERPILYIVFFFKSKKWEFKLFPQQNFLQWTNFLENSLLKLVSFNTVAVFYSFMSQSKWHTPGISVLGERPGVKG